MKLVTFLLFLLPAGAFCQSKFESDIKAIIDNAARKFSTFKGAFKTTVYRDSVYYSTSIIDETSDNGISVGSEGRTYFATIADSLTEDEGLGLLAVWKERFVVVLTGFSVSKWNTCGFAPLAGGWDFKNQRTWVLLHLSRNRNHDSYRLAFSISHWHDK